MLECMSSTRWESSVREERAQIPAYNMLISHLLDAHLRAHAHVCVCVRVRACSFVALRGQMHYKLCLAPRADALQVWTLSEDRCITSCVSLRGQMHSKLCLSRIVQTC